jgi:hypothetical protein
MMCFRRGFAFVGLVMLIVLTGAIVGLAALTTWWVLFALVPLVMMAGCMAMVGAMARFARDDPSAWQWGCCTMNPAETRRSAPRANQY